MYLRVACIACKTPDFVNCLESTLDEVHKSSAHVLSFSHVQITEKDEAVLEHLVDLSCDELEGEEEAGFRLTFHFRENAFFSNTTLVRISMRPSETG